jgi:hypothetical protein
MWDPQHLTTLQASTTCYGKREKEREREKWVVVRDTTMGGKENNLSSVLKVPRQCPLVLPVRGKTFDRYY